MIKEINSYTERKREEDERSRIKNEEKHWREIALRLFERPEYEVGSLHDNYNRYFIVYALDRASQKYPEHKLAIERAKNKKPFDEKEYETATIHAYLYCGRKEIFIIYPFLLYPERHKIEITAGWGYEDAKRYAKEISNELRGEVILDKCYPEEEVVIPPEEIPELPTMQGQTRTGRESRLAKILHKLWKAKNV